MADKSHNIVYFKPFKGDRNSFMFQQRSCNAYMTHMAKERIFLDILI